MTDVIAGHVPVLPPRRGERPPTPDARLLHHFGLCSACDVTDAVGRLYSMDSGMRPLYTPMRRTVGVAVTVKAVPGDNLAIHAALGTVGADDILVVDWRGHMESCGSGVLSLIDPIRRGLRGLIIDGAWRDVDELQALDFPVFGRGISPYSPPKNELGELNVPVSCGGVVVEPGDIIVADEGGVAVVPARSAEAVASVVEPFVAHTQIGDYPIEELHSSALARHERLMQAFDEAELAATAAERQDGL